MMELSQRFMFECAHTLARNIHGDEAVASRRIHGHTYTAEVTVRGTKGAHGFLEVGRGASCAPLVVDLFVLRQEIERVRIRLDHCFLDEVDDLGPPTLENLCEFIARGLGAIVHAVTVARATGDSCRLVVTPDQK